MQTSKGAQAGRLQIFAPQRQHFTGIRVAGYFWPDSPPTLVEVTDDDKDGPHDGGVRRISRETYARLVEAQRVGRLVIIPDSGEQASIDQETIARLSEELTTLRSELRDTRARFEESQLQVVQLREGAQRDARAVAEAREELAVQKRRTDELAAKLKDAVKKAKTAEPEQGAEQQK